MSFSADGPVCAECGPVVEAYKNGRVICPNQKRKFKGKHRGSKYGLTAVQVAALPSVCEICGEQEASRIDHCHTSGRVRGHLCNSCNLGLGFFRDTPEFLERAIKYLNER